MVSKLLLSAVPLVVLVARKKYMADLENVFKLRRTDVKPTNG